MGKDEGSGMIPRYQQVLFVLLVIATVVMGVALIHMRRAAADRLSSAASTPNIAPAADQHMQDIKLWLANDADDTMSSVTRQLALPESPNARARVLLSALLTDYSKPLSMHPLPAGTAVDDVFLLPLKIKPTEMDIEDNVTPEVAVVNFDRSFAEKHPSSITSEMMTIRSIVRTLHANIPGIRQVRFLIDGQQKPTLAGHADLTRAYSALEEVPTDKVTIGDVQP
jgi:hypothetical protein